MDKTKILVVDDENHVLQIYADILQEHDITLEFSRHYRQLNSYKVKHSISLS